MLRPDPLPGKLKVDFHTHTNEDPKDYIDFSARELIDKSAEQGLDALAITNHDVVTFRSELEEYAERRGILLIPGVELTLSNKHVVVINPAFRTADDLKSFQDLAQIRRATTLIIAPHPYYPGSRCLRSDLETHVDSFDAVEFSFFYSRFVNPNRRAVRVAERRRKPLVGSSDCHNIWQVGYTYSLVEAEKTIPSIVAAVKKGRVEVVTRPLSMQAMLRVGVNWVMGDKLGIRLRI
jgi:predicted metal-dependent phosphoesterase TrpH